MIVFILVVINKSLALISSGNKFGEDLKTVLKVRMCHIISEFTQFTVFRANVDASLMTP